MQNVSGSWFSSAIFSFAVFWLVYMAKAPVSYELFHSANMIYFLVMTGVAFFVSVLTILLSPNDDLKDTGYMFAMASVFAAVFGWVVISETSAWVYNTFSKYANIPLIMSLVSALYQEIVALVVLFILLIIAAIIYKFGASK